MYILSNDYQLDTKWPLLPRSRNITLFWPPNSVSIPCLLQSLLFPSGNHYPFIIVIVFLLSSFNLTMCICIYKNMHLIWTELHCIIFVTFSFNGTFIRFIHVVVYIGSFFIFIAICCVIFHYVNISHLLICFTVDRHLGCLQFRAVIMMLLWTFFYVYPDVHKDANLLQWCPTFDFCGPHWKKKSCLGPHIKLQHVITKKIS